MSDGASDCYGRIDVNNMLSPTVSKPAKDYNGTITVSNGTGRMASSRGIPGDPVGSNGQRLSDEIKEMEDCILTYHQEYRLIKEQIWNMQRTLGMEPPTPGTLIKLSTALKEIALEIDKRMDAATFKIDPVITL